MLEMDDEGDQDDKTNASDVFSEHQRKAVRERLLGLKAKRDKELPTVKDATVVKKKESHIPLLVDQEYHTSFTIDAYRPELDEIQYLFLFRMYFLPYYRNKTPLTMEKLRFLSEMCGLSSTIIEDTMNGYTFNGEMLRGGPVKRISFHLKHSLNQRQRMVTIREIIFYTKKKDK